MDTDLFSPVVDYISPLCVNGQVAHISRVKTATKQFKLNLPVSLREELEKRAKRNHRKLTAEMIFLLDQSVRGEAPGRGVFGVGDEQGAYVVQHVERRLLTAFRKLSDEQRNALLVLLGA